MNQDNKDLGLFILMLVLAILCVMVIIYVALA